MSVQETAIGKNTASGEALSDSESLVAQTVVFQLHLRALSFKAKVNSEAIAPVGTNPDRLSAQKDLINKKAGVFKKFTKNRTDFKKFIANRSVRTGILKGGMFLVPRTLVSELDAEYLAFAERDRQLITDFVNALDELTAEGQGALGPLRGGSGETPTADEVTAAFSASYRYLTLNVPAALAEANEEIFRRESERSEVEWTAARTEIREGLRSAMYQIIEHAADRLGVDEDGKPRVFRDSLVKQMTDFLSTFEARDLTGDAQLAALAKQARELISGKSAQDLRSEEGLRDAVKRGIDQIKATMDTMITSKDRRIILDEDNDTLF